MFVRRLFLDASLHLYKKVCPSVGPLVRFFFRILEIAYFRPERRIQSGAETHACTNTRTRTHTHIHTHTHKRAAELNELVEPQRRGIATLTHTLTHIQGLWIGVCSKEPI